MATAFMIDALEFENESFYLDGGFQVELLRDCRCAPSLCLGWFFTVLSTSGKVLKTGSGKTSKHMLRSLDSAIKKLRSKGITGY